MLIEVHEKSESINKRTKKRGEGRTNEFTGINFAGDARKERARECRPRAFLPAFRVAEARKRTRERGTAGKEEETCLQSVIKRICFLIPDR